MAKLVKLELTDSDCLSLRLALNATAMEWGEKASAHRANGEDLDARTCESIRSDYHRLWDMVNVAQEARGRVHDWTYRRPADDVARREAREKAYAQATSCPSQGGAARAGRCC
jgi:hypothetical protein